MTSETIVEITNNNNNNNNKSHNKPTNVANEHDK